MEHSKSWIYSLSSYINYLRLFSLLLYLTYSYLLILKVHCFTYFFPTSNIMCILIQNSTFEFLSTILDISFDFPITFFWALITLRYLMLDLLHYPITVISSHHNTSRIIQSIQPKEIYENGKVFYAKTFTNSMDRLCLLCALVSSSTESGG